MSLRILLCTHSPADGRTAVYRSQTTRAEYLRQQGHQVDVLTPADLMSIRLPRLDPFLLPVVLACRRLTRYDVVIFHSYLGWAFHALRFCLDPSKRVVTITAFHGLEPLYLTALLKEAERTAQRLSWRFRLMHAALGVLLKLSCRRSAAIFCLNSLEADYLIRHRWANPERIHQIANGVEPECFVDRDYTSSPKRILFIGQWLAAKGTRYLVDAFIELAAATDIELACVGTRAPSETVLASFPPHVRTRVTVIPDVDRGELQDQLSKADLFVFPSLSEGFSFALLEAMAAGLPIIATPAGAAVDILIDGSNALVVPFADAISIVAAVQRFCTDGPLRERLGTAARGAAARCMFASTAADFNAVLSGVANRHQTRHVSSIRAGEDVIS